MILSRVVRMVHIIVREVHPLLFRVQLTQLCVDVSVTRYLIEEGVGVREAEFYVCKVLHDELVVEIYHDFFGDG